MSAPISDINRPTAAFDSAVVGLFCRMARCDGAPVPTPVPSDHDLFLPATDRQRRDRPRCSTRPDRPTDGPGLIVAKNNPRSIL